MKSPKKYKDRYAEYPASDFQKRGSEILSEVQHSLEPVIITRHDKPVAFVASMELLEKLEGALLEKLEEEGARIKTMTRAIRKTVQAADSAEEQEARTVTVALARKIKR